MDDLHLEVLKLKDRVEAIQRNQDYAKVIQSTPPTKHVLACGLKRSLVIAIRRKAPSSKRRSRAPTARQLGCRCFRYTHSHGNLGRYDLLSILTAACCVASRSASCSLPASTRRDTCRATSTARSLFRTPKRKRNNGERFAFSEEREKEETRETFCLVHLRCCCYCWAPALAAAAPRCRSCCNASCMALWIRRQSCVYGTQ